MKYSGTPGGNRLKALRELAGRTQLDIELDASLGMGYLQRVESGKVRHPERETLERILAALGVRYTERREVLEMFGYIVDAPVPNEGEMRWAVDACQAEIHNGVFPAYLLDCAHRLLAWNTFASKLLNVRLQALMPILRLLFDPAYNLMPRIANPQEFFPAQIRALRYEMYPFQNELWYKTLIEDMLGYRLFEQYWTASQTQQMYPTAARPLVPIELNIADVGVLQFRLVAEHFAQDRRFRMIYYLPAEPKTMQHCLTWLHSAQ
jgi:transcriptional regulator with XRE-family HTH domain